MPINEYYEFKGNKKKRVSLKLVFFIIMLLFITSMAYELSKSINKLQGKLEAHQAAIDELINLK